MNWLLNCLAFVAVITAWVVLRNFFRSMGRGARQRCRAAFSPLPPAAFAGCPRWGAGVPSNASFCPRCGIAAQHGGMPPPLPNARRPGAAWLVFALLGLIAMLLCMFVAQSRVEQKAPPRPPFRVLER